MRYSEYEQLVEQLLRDLEGFDGWKLHRNRKYPGVRQPGDYEIDIALEADLHDIASLLFIVECKNWKKAVDRPVVQKLAQTRDAVGAHKAAIASPVGFSAGAVAVARVHGIALWVVAKNRMYCILRYTPLTEVIWYNSWSRRYARAQSYRDNILAALGADSNAPASIISIENAQVNDSRRGDEPALEFRCTERAFKAESDSASPGYDRRLAVTQIAYAALGHHFSAWSTGVSSSGCSVCGTFSDISRDLQDAGVELHEARRVVETIALGDIPLFLKSARRTWTELDSRPVRLLKQLRIIRAW